MTDARATLLRARAHLDAAIAELAPLEPRPGLPFGPLIRARREEMGLSLQDLASASGVSKPHIWTMEQQTSTNPEVWTVVALARALGLDPVDLFRSAMSPPRDVIRVAARTKRLSRACGPEDK